MLGVHIDLNLSYVLLIVKSWGFYTKPVSENHGFTFFFNVYTRNLESMRALNVPCCCSSWSDCDESYSRRMNFADISMRQIKSGIMCVSLLQRFGWISEQILLRRKCEKELTSSFQRLWLVWICMFMERFIFTFCLIRFSCIILMWHLQTLISTFYVFFTESLYYV